MDLFTELQTILQMLLDTAVIGGTLAVGVLAGYAIFKLLTLASLLWFAKFVCQKIYELLKQKLDQETNRPKITNIEVKGKIISITGTEEGAILLARAIEKAALKHSHGYMSFPEARNLADYIESYTVN